MSSLSCLRCGGALDLGDRFCPRCGAEVEAQDATGAIPVVAAPDDSGPIPVVAHGAGVDDLPRGTAALVVLRGRDQGARFVLDGDSLAAGRADEADVFLDDVTVSRQHALITREGTGWSISDVGSLNGTYVNRAIVTGPRRLEPGDEVQIGKYRFAYLVSGAPSPGGSGTT